MEPDPSIQDESVKEVFIKEKESIVRRMDECKKRLLVQLAEIEKIGTLVGKRGMGSGGCWDKQSHNLSLYS